MASPHSRNKRRRDSRQVQKKLREKDSRIQSAARRTHDQQAALEARIALEQAEAAAVKARQVAEESTTTSTAVKLQERKKVTESKQAVADEAIRAKKREEWPLSQARNMLRQGYTLEHCVWATGWDEKWFEGALDFEDTINGNF